MRRRGIWILIGVAAAGAVAAVLMRGAGVSARRAPSDLEARVAGAAWRFLVPAASRDMANPITFTEETFGQAATHWADHCAVCHDADGSGRTAVGRGMFPPAPDMRRPETQALTDGELFYAIEEGIPWTGMPAWHTGSEDGARQSWELVHLIRRLPALTPEQVSAIEGQMPQSPAQLRRQAEIDAFLKGK